MSLIFRENQLKTVMNRSKFSRYSDTHHEPAATVAAQTAEHESVVSREYDRERCHRQPHQDSQGRCKQNMLIGHNSQKKLNPADA